MSGAMDSEDIMMDFAENYLDLSFSVEGRWLEAAENFADINAQQVEAEQASRESVF